VIQAVLREPQDPTQLWLLYGNRTPDDILLRAQLDDMAAKDRRFKAIAATLASLSVLTQTLRSLAHLSVFSSSDCPSIHLPTYLMLHADGPICVCLPHSGVVHGGPRAAVLRPGALRVQVCDPSWPAPP
jgi:hypothetical protein